MERRPFINGTREVRFSAREEQLYKLLVRATEEEPITVPKLVSCVLPQGKSEGTRKSTVNMIAALRHKLADRGFEIVTATDGRRGPADTSYYLRRASSMPGDSRKRSAGNGREFLANGQGESLLVNLGTRHAGSVLKRILLSGEGLAGESNLLKGVNALDLLNQGPLSKEQLGALLRGTKVEPNVLLAGAIESAVIRFWNESQVRDIEDDGKIASLIENCRTLRQQGLSLKQVVKAIEQMFNVPSTMSA